jgi:hypothetical protein
MRVKAVVLADTDEGGGGVSASSDLLGSKPICCPNPAASRHIRSDLHEPHRSEKRCKSLQNRELEPNPRMEPDPPPKR